MSEERKPVVGDRVLYNGHIWTVQKVNEEKNSANIVINGRTSDSVTVSWSNLRFAEPV